MAKYSKGNYDGPNGIHGVPLWRIAGFALNNAATNLYFMLMAQVGFYLNGFVGASVVLAGSFSMIMRIWDGVTDPFIGMLLDKTNGKFGKNRPFMLIGNAILFATSFVLFNVTHLLPEAVRLPFFFVMSAFYYIGYTFQCVVTKSAQTCMTNDPKQRPLFSIFDGFLVSFVVAGVQILASSYLVPKYGKMTDLGLFHELWIVVAVVSVIFTLIAMFCIAPKDNSKYFGTGKTVKVGLKDYVDVLTHNRAIQMLVLSASTDKLGGQARTSTATVILYGIVAGNFALSGIVNGFTTVFNLIFMLLGAGLIATKLGQRKAMLVGSIGGLIGCTLMILLWTFGDPNTISLPGDGRFVSFNFISIALLVLTVVGTGFANLASVIVVPMTADCADYETYRSGKYVPGLIGTLFSFVDKVVSSLGPMVASLALVAIGFRDKLPDVDTPCTPQLKAVGLFLCYGMIMIGLILNLIAMKFYPLTKEKMEEIQGEIARIKAEAAV